MQNESKKPNGSSKILNTWLTRFAETFQKSGPLSEPQVESYRLALSDLTASQLEDACFKVLRDWTFAVMPPPGFIRECVTAKPQYLGPPQEKYPEVTPEDREGAEEYSQALWKVLNSTEKYSPPQAIQLKQINSAELDEMLKDYRDWLIAEAERDRFDQSIGLPPVPRHEAERLAIFLAMPVEARRKMARSGEWTKLITANI